MINGKEYGYIDIGKDSEKDEMPEAENALVFMLVCVNGGWKIPVFHYFVKALGGEQQSELTKEILMRLSETGVIITSVTFDGLKSNFTMCKRLGAKIFQRIPWMRTFFILYQKSRYLLYPMAAMF